MRKIRDQSGASSELFWAYLRGKRKDKKVRRMKDDEGRMVEGVDEVLKVMAEH